MSGAMGVGSKGQIFKHSTDKVEGSLMVQFFGLVFTVAPPPPWKFFCRRPWRELLGRNPIWREPLGHKSNHYKAGKCDTVPASI